MFVAGDLVIHNFVERKLKEPTANAVGSSLECV